MSTDETERRVRALAGAANLPQGFDTWPGVLARVPRVRRRRTAARAVTAAVVALAVAAAVAVPLTVGAPASAEAAARRAAAVSRTGAGLPPLELTEVTSTKPVGFQPEPPPPRITEHIDYESPTHWRTESTVTEPFGEGTQTITQIRNGPRIATVAAGRVTITRTSGQGQLPFTTSAAVQALRKLLAAGSVGGCAPSVSSPGDGPLIAGRPTLIIQTGPSPCPSADFPQSDGPATFWLDKQTFLVLRADLHGPGNRLDQTIRVTGLRYHVTFPQGTFRLPKPGAGPTACPGPVFAPLIPASLPDGLRAGAAASNGAATGHCITSYTITYRDPAGHPAVQLYEAPQASPAVRFPGRAVTIRPGLAGTLNSSSAMVILWWIQDGRYCSLQTGGLTAGVRLTRVPTAVLLHTAASLDR
ncbi:MAG TPA: hypothetical protein VGS19_03075 [Streptosporangiaceae bacterium]|nr:hypothetical protein [Streptosporangiaceae bacterium]